MQDQDAPVPIDLIKSIAKIHHVSLHDDHIACFLFVYAHVIEESCKRLASKTISKTSLQEMEDALDQIHYQLGIFKISGKLDENDRIYSDIENIIVPLGIVIGQLRAALAIYDDTLPDPRRRPEKLRTRHQAILLYNESLLPCRNSINEIYHCIRWWSDELLTTDCQDLTSAG